MMYSFLRTTGFVLALVLLEATAFIPISFPQHQRLSYTSSQYRDDNNKNTLTQTTTQTTTMTTMNTKLHGWNREVFTSAHDELMYALGINLGRQLGDVRPLVNDGEELAQVAKGLLDAIVGRLDENGQREIIKRRGKELDQLILERADSLRKKLEESGKQMLESMGQTEGARKLNSGVVVHVLEHGPAGPGRGVRPTASSVVEIHYHGTLPDGTVFDTTMANDEPVQLPLAQVIPGWRDGVLEMHEGESMMMGIPPALAYGENGTPDGSIPGGATLFFKVQLIKVVSGGIGGEPALLGIDGKPLIRSSGGSGLLGPDGRPL